MSKSCPQQVLESFVIRSMDLWDVKFTCLCKCARSFNSAFSNQSPCFTRDLHPANSRSEVPAGDSERVCTGSGDGSAPVTKLLFDNQTNEALVVLLLCHGNSVLNSFHAGSNRLEGSMPSTAITISISFSTGLIIGIGRGLIPYRSWYASEGDRHPAASRYEAERYCETSITAISTA